MQKLKAAQESENLTIAHQSRIGSRTLWRRFLTIPLQHDVRIFLFQPIDFAEKLFRIKTLQQKNITFIGAGLIERRQGNRRIPDLEVLERTVLGIKASHPLEVFPKPKLTAALAIFELYPFLELLGEMLLGQFPDLFVQEGPFPFRFGLVFCGTAVPLDILKMESPVVGAHELEIFPAVDVRIFRSADPELVHQEVGDFLSGLGVFNPGKKIVGRNRAFVALFKNLSNPMQAHKMSNHSGNILLSLQRVVGILNIDDFFGREPLRGNVGFIGMPILERHRQARQMM
ncbi:MAG: hypothetical protein WC352_01785 [Candidatus Omnitrophota bacterium]